MDTTQTHDHAREAGRSDIRDRWWGRRWPATLGVLLAGVTGYGLADGREVARLVVAIALIYLAAAVIGRAWVSWVGLGALLPLIVVADVSGVDATPWMLALAAVLVILGIAGRRARPAWGMPLQAAAMVVLGAVAVLAVRLDPTAGGLLVAGALFAHAAWDVHHHRTGRVVARSYAEFCVALDLLLGVLVATTALSW